METKKLPQARYYLRAANYGIDALLAQHPMDEKFLFFVVGVLASLRAVQHALLNHDSTLSAQHKTAIEEWKRTTPMNGPEITFIKNSRDLILKRGSFAAFATTTHGGIGEGESYQITSEGYDAGYYVDGKRRDLIEDVRNAAAWCDQQLKDIEKKVPPVQLKGTSKEN
jgi:hypothetical protein